MNIRNMILSAAIGLGTLTSMAAQGTSSEPAVGQPAPDFSLTTGDGSQMSLKDYRGKWVVLYFYPNHLRRLVATSLAVGAGTIGAGLLPNIRTAEASGGLTPGDAALLRFAAAAEMLVEHSRWRGRKTAGQSVITALNFTSMTSWWRQRISARTIRRGRVCNSLAGALSILT